MRLLGGKADDARLQRAAWVARCVGRGTSAPLRPEDISALATTLNRHTVPRGAVAYGGDHHRPGVWIVRSGQLELSAGTGSGRAVVQILRGGDVDGDIQLLLDLPMPYTARALDDVELLHLEREDFERLLATSLPIARRWLSSVAERLNTSHMRILGLLGRTLTQQTAQLLLDEATDGAITVPQRTLAAMLGVRRPSLNKVLKELEKDRLITLGYSAIAIVDEKGLTRRAG
ncbi:HTH-type transcriptional regulator Cmr [Salinactinospora qingdaonensis]|uniref:HTH-type transcriptional regulator Cmr n=1 Tax=Salinactinospora qingdaonensis TaxID=702744 RepID=A0ABP7F5V2_9ACTN